MIGNKNTINSIRTQVIDLSSQALSEFSIKYPEYWEECDKDYKEITVALDSEEGTKIGNKF